MDGRESGPERRLREPLRTQKCGQGHTRALALPGHHGRRSRSRCVPLTVKFSLNLIQPESFHLDVGSASELSVSCPTVFFLLSLCNPACKGHSRGISVGTHRGSCAQEPRVAGPTYQTVRDGGTESPCLMKSPGRTRAGQGSNRRLNPGVAQGVRVWLAGESAGKPVWATARNSEKLTEEWAAVAGAADSFFKTGTGSGHWLGQDRGRRPP